MLEKLYNAIRNDAEPKEITLCGRTYTTGKVNPVEPPTPSRIKASTLTALLDYLKTNVDRLDIEDLVCHVESPTDVLLMSKLHGEFPVRAKYIELNAEIPDHHFDRWFDSEAFNIWIQAGFVTDEYEGQTDKTKVLRYVGNVQCEAAQQVADDGVTQIVTVRKGVAALAQEILPNPVRLAPYRTFTEIEQPPSDFVFRASEGPHFKLVEADGGAWRRRAMQQIKAYLNEHLPELLVIA